MFHRQGPSIFELTRQRLSSTQRAYDLLAPKFDHTPFRTPESVLSVVVAQLEGSAPIDSLLDVCCGTGAAIKSFRPLCNRRLVGLDLSAGMLQVARTATRSPAGGARLEFTQGNALDLPFGPHFDLVVSFGAFGHILPQDQSRLIRQIAGALRPGGRFIFVTSEMPPKWSKTHWFYRAFNAANRLRNLIIRPPFVMYYLTFLPPKVQALLEDNGFTVKVDRPFAKPFERLYLMTATLNS